MNPEVTIYFQEGCGRCKLVGTPACKVHNWTKELALLRQIILKCGLTEERKWGVACYTAHGKNVLLLSAFKDFCCISFFKGVLLQDPAGILKQQGKHTRAGRIIPFTKLTDVKNVAALLPDYINEAVEITRAGIALPKEKNSEPIPVELQCKLDEDSAFHAAFTALTPGRQRGYILYFSGAKQSKTRSARIEKYKAHILQGKGMHDR